MASRTPLDDAREIINSVDAEMAELFVKRMEAVKAVAEYKKAMGLKIYDENREKEVITRNSEKIGDEMREYYKEFLKSNMAVSRNYQNHLINQETNHSENGNVTKIRLKLGINGYDITVGRGLLSSAKSILNLDRKVFILTDSGVPEEYAKTIKNSSKEAKIFTVQMGEGAKSPEVYSRVLAEMLDFGMTRTDCAVAVGGGVVGDLMGFAAATFMRGIDFYNVPTTLLSQVDSSVGGKTAINLSGIKNSVGAFHQPKGVLVDLDTLKTLPKRQLSNGLAEALKMALTFDSELFSLFEKTSLNDNDIEKIVVSSLNIKKNVVEKDERERGLRKVLNFGHTFGHAVESEKKMSDLLHGECVAIGMLVTSSDKVRAKLIPILKKLELPTEYEGNVQNAIKFLSHDKKCSGDEISVIFVDEIGTYRCEKMKVDKFADLACERLSSL